MLQFTNGQDRSYSSVLGKLTQSKYNRPKVKHLNVFQILKGWISDPHCIAWKFPNQA